MTHIACLSNDATRLALSAPPPLRPTPSDTTPRLGVVTSRAALASLLPLGEAPASYADYIGVCATWRSGGPPPLTPLPP